MDNIIFIAVGLILLALGSLMLAKGARLARTLNPPRQEQKAVIVKNANKNLLPKIQDQFPDFTLEKYLPLAEESLQSIFGAITAQNISLLKHCDDRLTHQVDYIIHQLQKDGIFSVFDEVAFSQSALVSLRQEGEDYNITFQTMVSCCHYKLKDKQLYSGSTSEKSHVRYNITLNSQHWLFTHYEKNA